MIAKPALVKEYINLFVNRRAFTMQSMRPHPESGRHYYYRPKNRESGAALDLTEKTISDHLEGTITIGLYAINPSNQRCKWVAIDADYTNAMEDLVRLQYYLTADQVDSAFGNEQAGRAPLDIPGSTTTGEEVPDLYLQFGPQTGGAGERGRFSRGNRGVPKARRDLAGCIRQRPSGSIGNPPWRKPPFLVLRRRLHPGGADGIPERLRRVTEEELDCFTAGKELPAEIEKPRQVAKPIGGQGTGRSQTKILHSRSCG